MNKTITIFLAVACIVLVGVVGFMHGRSSQEEVPQTEAPIGAAGDYYSTQKIAAEEISVTTTSTISMYNSDTRDRIILETFFFMENATSTAGAQRTLYVATSSEETSFGANTNYIWEQLIVTTTPVFYASTTASYTEGTYKNIWPASSYLHFFLSDTVSSGTPAYLDQTATGVGGVRYVYE